MESKVCTSCYKEFTLDHFYKNSSGKFGKSQKCKTCSKKISKYYRDLDPVKSFSNKYDANPEDISKLLKGDKCDICGNSEDRLVIDHCHSTGELRGRLCFKCNLGLGYFKDNPDLLAVAACYLGDNHD